jgi:hypothetical protein
MAQFAHRTAGGNGSVDNRAVVSRYERALRSLEKGEISGRFHEVLLALHAIVTGEERSTFRNHGIAMKANRDNAPVSLKRTTPDMVLRSLEDIETHLIENPNIGSLQRALLVFYEILNVHPFSDGNGRVGRLVLQDMLRGHFRIPVVIDLTLVMRSDFRRFNGLLEASRSPEVYREFVVFFRELLLTEMQQMTRLAAALERLDCEQSELLRTILSVAFEKIVGGDDVDQYLHEHVSERNEPHSLLLRAALT